MADELKLASFTVSAPINGVRHWRALIRAENFNAATPLMQPDKLETVLLPYGRNVLVHNMNMSYQGSAPGVSIEGGYRTANTYNQYFEKQVTVFTNDSLRWDLGWYFELTLYGSTNAYSLWMNVDGYAATDDMYINLNGEVW